MASVQKTIDVNVPVETAYNQWTQFESFPQFMHGIQEVQQLDDTHLHWRAVINGKPEEWDAVITEQIPDDRIAWKSTSGVDNAGVVTFHRLTNDSSRVALQLEYAPEGVVEAVGDALGFVSRQIEGDLQRFKEFIERQGTESGAWRGEVKRPETVAAGTVPGAVTPTMQTATGEYGNAAGANDMGTAWGEAVPGFGVGRSGTQGMASDDVRAAAGATATPATHQTDKELSAAARRSDDARTVAPTREADSDAG